MQGARHGLLLLRAWAPEGKFQGVRSAEGALRARAPEGLGAGGTACVALACRMLVLLII
jgi:hypothetical protein